MLEKIKRFLRKHAWKIALVASVAETTQPTDVAQQLSNVSMNLLTTILLVLVPIMAFAAIIRRVLEKI